MLSKSLKSLKWKIVFRTVKTFLTLNNLWINKFVVLRISLIQYVTRWEQKLYANGKSGAFFSSLEILKQNSWKSDKNSNTHSVCNSSDPPLLSKFQESIFCQAALDRLHLFEKYFFGETKILNCFITTKFCIKDEKWRKNPSILNQQGIIWESFDRRFLFKKKKLILRLKVWIPG